VDADITGASIPKIFGLTMNINATPEGLIPRQREGGIKVIVRKAVRMSMDMKVPLLGIIENMSYFECPETGTRYELFGHSHVEEVTQLAGVPLLARLPVDTDLAGACDSGRIEGYRNPVMDGVAQSIDLTLGKPVQS